MIARLSGSVASVRGSAIILDVQGVGYHVFVTTYALGRLAGLETATLFIHTHVREDALLLYGFLDEDELHMFELLISISGIGPKVALSILSIADPKTIKVAITNQDASILTRVSGVGKKTAERVILELQNKVEAVQFSSEESALGDADALDALTALGYSVTQARDALKQLPKDVTDIGARIRQALKNLGKER
ncbi:MAG: Holliday junction branch migration protein RuvA [Candidatus Moraniibacteriota bacterium]